MNESVFLEAALAEFSFAWEGAALQKLSTLEIPGTVLGWNKSILKSDICMQWAKWFTESFADPHYYAHPDKNYVDVFSDVLKLIQSNYNNIPHEQKTSLASIIAQNIENQALGIRNFSKRVNCTPEEKKYLLAMAGEPPRCWICGAQFEDEAIENFKFKTNYDLKPYDYIDILKPRGLVAKDLVIEIDHVVPFSLISDNNIDNLSLACGWCNRYKSNKMSLYDVSGQPVSLEGSNRLGINSLPQPFWTVRLLAIRRKCDFNEYCDKTLDNSELTIAPINKTGVLNPTNLRATCREHDPIKEHRLQSASYVEKLWRGS